MGVGRIGEDLLALSQLQWGWEDEAMAALHNQSETIEEESEGLCLS